MSPAPALQQLLDGYVRFLAQHPSCCAHSRARARARPHRGQFVTTAPPCLLVPAALSVDAPALYLPGSVCAALSAATKTPGRKKKKTMPRMTWGCALSALFLPRRVFVMILTSSVLRQQRRRQMNPEGSLLPRQQSCTCAGNRSKMDVSKGKGPGLAAHPTWHIYMYEKKKKHRAPCVPVGTRGMRRVTPPCMQLTKNKTRARRGSPSHGHIGGNRNRSSKRASEHT